MAKSKTLKVSRKSKKTKKEPLHPPPPPLPPPPPQPPPPPPEEEDEDQKIEEVHDDETQHDEPLPILEPTIISRKIKKRKVPPQSSPTRDKKYIGIAKQQHEERTTKKKNYLMYNRKKAIMRKIMALEDVGAEVTLLITKKKEGKPRKATMAYVSESIVQEALPLISSTYGIGLLATNKASEKTKAIRDSLIQACSKKQQQQQGV